MGTHITLNTSSEQGDDHDYSTGSTTIPSHPIPSTPHSKIPSPGAARPPAASHVYKIQNSRPRRTVHFTNPIRYREDTATNMNSKPERDGVRSPPMANTPPLQRRLRISHGLTPFPLASTILPSLVSNTELWVELYPSRGICSRPPHFSAPSLSMCNATAVSKASALNAHPRLYAGLP